MIGRCVTLAIIFYGRLIENCWQTRFLETNRFKLVVLVSASLSNNTCSFSKYKIDFSIYNFVFVSSIYIKSVGFSKNLKCF